MDGCSDQQAMLIHVRHSLPCDDACSCTAKQELSTDLAGLTRSSKKFSCSAAAYVRHPAERTYALLSRVWCFIPISYAHVSRALIPTRASPALGMGNRGN